MSITELETRIAEIQQELSVVKEVSAKPDIILTLWGLSFLAAILLIIIILFLILREEEDFTVKNIISVLAYNLRPSSIKEKIASLSHKRKVTLLTVAIACIVVILEGEEYRVRDGIDIGGRYLVSLADLEDDSFFPRVKVFMYISEDFTDIMVEYED